LVFFFFFFEIILEKKKLCKLFRKSISRDQI